MFCFVFLLQDSPDTNREQIVKLSVSRNAFRLIFYRDVWSFKTKIHFLFHEIVRPEP